MRAPLLILALSFFAGVAVATGFASESVEIALLALVAAGATVAALTSHGRGRGRGGVVLALLVALLFALGLARAADGPPGGGSLGGGRLADFTGREVVLEGIVEADPIVRGSDQEVRLAAQRVSLGPESVDVAGDALIRTGPGLALRYGDRVQARVGLRAVVAQGGTEFEDYLAERGIAATGFAREVTILERDAGNPIRAALSEARAELDTGLARALDEPLAGLAQGIVTGRRGAPQRDLRTDLNDTGLSHLVVISGSNVTLLAALVAAASAWLLGRRRAI